MFGEDKKKEDAPEGEKKDGPKAPAAGGMAATHDPNYQTLAGMGNDQVSRGPQGPRINDFSGFRRRQEEGRRWREGQAAGSGRQEQEGRHPRPELPDPRRSEGRRNFRALTANIAFQGDCFGDDKKGKEGGEKKPQAPEDKNKKAATHDPNYQTLAGVKGR